MGRSTKCKPEKVSWYKYYAEPVVDGLKYSLAVFGAFILWVCVRVAKLSANIYTHLMGYWYCEYCNKKHCRRVYRYQLLIGLDNDHVVSYDGKVGSTKSDPCHTADAKYVCSLGKDYIHSHKGWQPATQDDKEATTSIKVNAALCIADMLERFGTPRH